MYARGIAWVETQLKSKSMGATKICSWTSLRWMKALQYHLKGGCVAPEKADCKSSECFLCPALQHTLGHCCQLRGGPSLLPWAPFCPSHSLHTEGKPRAALSLLPSVSPCVCVSAGPPPGSGRALPGHSASSELLLLSQSLWPECHQGVSLMQLKR